MKILIFITFIILSNNLLANQLRHHGHVKNIEAGNSNGDIFFNTNEPTITHECSNPAGYIVSAATHSEEKILSILLAAKMGNKGVYFDISGCVFNYPKVIRVGIK